MRVDAALLRIGSLNLIKAVDFATARELKLSCPELLSPVSLWSSQTLAVRHTAGSQLPSDHAH
jgi:hypothetical protein